jgi:hypothetical protein
MTTTNHTEQQLKIDLQPSEGRCRYCGERRPAGYSVTCGRSVCQEAHYHDKEIRTPKRGRR